MNILILSAGTRNKIIQYFKKTLSEQDKVVATDMQAIAPAIYEADKYYIVPSIKEPNYVDAIIDICKKEQINGVLSLIDSELSLLAENQKRFEAIGTIVIGSSYDLCEMSLNKMLMYEWLTIHDYKCAKYYTDKDEFFAEIKSGRVNYPVYVKPIRGSASISNYKVFNEEAIELLFKNSDSLMIQEFIDGQEIGADVYIDMLSGKVVSIFTKRKYLMRDGETYKAESFKDGKLFEFIKRFVTEAGYRGQIDIDIFEVNGEYFIIDVNPRFGGGYPHAFESGANHMKLIVNNLEGKTNECVVGRNYEEGTVMMKYSEVMVKKVDNDVTHRPAAMQMAESVVAI